MRTIKILTIIFLLVIFPALSGNLGNLMPRIHSAAAACPLTVDLDAGSTTQTDTVVTTSASSPTTCKLRGVLQARPPAIGQSLTAYASFKYIDANTNAGQGTVAV